MGKNSDNYIPKSGDFIWIDFEPTGGQEQRGHRPALVLSPLEYNVHGLLICVPITPKVRLHPFAVLVSEGKRTGTVLSDQARSVDWRTKSIKFIAESSDSLLFEVSNKLQLLLPQT